MKKKFMILIITISFTSLFLGACNIFFEPDNSAVTTYEYFWTLFDENYANFAAKPSIDWGTVDSEHRPLVNDSINNEELWGVLTSMIDELDDEHVFISYNDKSRAYISGGVGEAQPADIGWVQDFYLSFAMDIEVIKENYLSDPQVSGQNEEENREIITYGQLPADVYYIHISTFLPAEGVITPGTWTKEIGRLVAQNKDAAGIVLDVRNNGGGLDVNLKQVASYFTNEEFDFNVVKSKTGPGHLDFTPGYVNKIEPDGSIYFDGPIVVLINGATLSSAEWFAYAMGQLDNVTLLGTVSAGAAGGVNGVDLLPNGWIVRMVREFNETPDGSDLEGSGVLPDITALNTIEEIEAGTDSQLEAALALF
jgi:carboxyl-terminal processing protease